MNKRISAVLILLFFLSLSGCNQTTQPQIATTTPIVYEFTSILCEGTGLTVSQLITENVSCLHDYTLQVSQMRTIEAAEVLVISGAGLEEFLSDALMASTADIIDASLNIPLICNDHEHEHHDDAEHHHEEDPHIWLSPENAQLMAVNICTGLINQYPQYTSLFQKNCQELVLKLQNLDIYGKEVLQDLRSREMITFHDGFAYFADAYELQILETVEEESGGEASAAELIYLIDLVHDYQLPAIFTETSGSTAAASIIAAETGIDSYKLNMGFSGKNYFDSMYDNFHAIKEALG